MPRPTNFSSFVDNMIRNAEEAVMPLITGAAFICFLWGVTLYLRSAGDEKARKDGTLYMTWGIVGLVVMFGVWGFVGLLAKIVGADVAVPQL
jgi:hypothetical protein